MINLILCNPVEDLNYNKKIIDVSNWRVIGETEDKTFFLITPNCRTYHIQDLTVKKFRHMIQSSLDVSKKGVLDSIALVCPKCHGKGVTDWVSDVVGADTPRGPFEPVFFNDLDKPVYGARIYTENKGWFYAYFSQAKIPEAHQPCSNCRGTGLHMFTQMSPDGKMGLTVHNFQELE